MLIYIHGENTFLSRDYLDKQIERFKKERDPQGYNVFRFDGEKDEAGKILEAIMSTPFLSPKRMIVVENLLSRKDDGLFENFKEIVEDKKIPQDNVVMVWQGGAIGKSKLAKDLELLLKKQEWNKEFTDLPKAQLLTWIKTEVKNRGGSLSQVAANYLAEHAGHDMWLLNTLIDQLVSFAEKKEIQLADVQLFLDEKVDDNIFNMVDAIVAGNRKTAFKLLEEQRRNGEEDMHLYLMILRQFRILIEMRDMYNREDNITSGILAKLLGLHPFVARKSLPLMKKYSLGKLKYIYQQLLEIDIKTKTGLGDQSLLIDLFIGKNST